jgi:hypothetical protein
MKLASKNAVIYGQIHGLPDDIFTNECVAGISETKKYAVVLTEYLFMYILGAA